MKYLHILAFILLVVGGLNWLAVAFGYNVVEMILGMGSITNAVYILVGASALFELVTHKKNCRSCAA